MKNKQPQNDDAPSAREGKLSRSAKGQHTLLNQLRNLIPAHLIPKLARTHKVDARKFSPSSHVGALMYGQLARTSSLNETCDALAVHAGEFSRTRNSTPPPRNTFSHANRTRNPQVAEDLYWEMLDHLQKICPGFTEYGKHSGFIFRLKRKIFAIDSTTLQLTLASIDWARHRRRKAAAKCHMRIDIGTFLPTFAVVEDAAHHDSVRAAQLCAGMDIGDVVLADRAYVDLRFLADLDGRGIFFVLRSKRKMLFETVKELPCKGDIIRDELVHLAGVKTSKAYPQVLRRVTALVEVDGRKMEMVFISNNLTWSARTIAELYRARWAIESFFKEIKQTLQLRDFVGANENGVKWQVWVGLLTHLLLGFVRHVSRWAHSFSRCVGIVRCALWIKVDLMELLRHYGSAGAPRRPVLCGKEPYLPGFEPFSNQPMGQQHTNAQ